MIPYTDTTITVKVLGVNIVGSTVHVILKQGDYTLDKIATATLDGSDTVASVDLTQAETSIFESGYQPIKVQVNWIDDGKRHATLTKTIDVFEQLKEAII